jgi:hypothetical protein
MISIDIFLIGLLITSALTGLATEAIKKILVEHGATYRANTLAGIVAIILSACIGIGYVILSDLNFSAHIIVCLLAQAGLSWLCAMVGYDKVIQTIKQFTSK